jgi:protein involved in polysaccharide export with SLBB domain
MTIRLLTLLLTVVGALPASAAAQTPSRPDYVIGPRDLIVVQVFGEPGASGTFRVEADGTITLPLIGRVQAGGKTLRETQNDITKALSDGFFTNPQVSASIQEYGSQKIFVVGEVRNPGSYPLSGETTLLAALALPAPRCQPPATRSSSTGRRPPRRQRRPRTARRLAPGPRAVTSS